MSQKNNFYWGIRNWQQHTELLVDWSVSQVTTVITGIFKKSYKIITFYKNYNSHNIKKYGSMTICHNSDFSKMIFGS